MTRLEKRFVAVLHAIAGELPAAAIEKLLAAGVIDLRACERRAIYEAVCAAENDGIPRCEAFEKIAREFCCSYEKARNAFYRTLRMQ